MPMHDRVKRICRKIMFASQKQQHPNVFLFQIRDWSIFLAPLIAAYTQLRSLRSETRFPRSVLYPSPFAIGTKLHARSALEEEKRSTCDLPAMRKVRLEGETDDATTWWFRAGVAARLGDKRSRTNRLLRQPRPGSNGNAKQ